METMRFPNIMRYCLKCGVKQLTLDRYGDYSCMVCRAIHYPKNGLLMLPRVGSGERLNPGGMPLHFKGGKFG